MSFEGFLFVPVEEQQQKKNQKLKYIQLAKLMTAFTDKRNNNNNIIIIMINNN